MPLTKCFNHQQVKGKDIYVVDDHHKALAAWVLVRRSLETPPNLITIDHHTDVHEAFLGHAAIEHYKHRAPDLEQFRLSLAAKINWKDDQSIINAISLLRHDEHIDAATCSKTLHAAFCIQLSDSDGIPSIEQDAYFEDRRRSWPNPPSTPKPVRPMTYKPTHNNIYVVPYNCFIGCEAMPHNDDCQLRLSEEVIESAYLDDQLMRGAEISKCIGLSNLEAEPYILDIDLDVFHTRSAISPRDASTFYRLIKNATAITIATESECVEELWLDEDDRMSSTDLLQKLLAHINKAL